MDTSQGDWAVNGTRRGGGADNARALVVDSFWRQCAGGGVLKMSSKSYLKIVPQIMQKKPRKIGFSKVFLHDLMYDLMYDKSYLKLYQLFL